MRLIFQLLKRLFLQILLLLFCYFLCRTVFTLINIEKFPGLNLRDYLRISFRALRFDLSTVATVNAAYFVLFLLPLPLYRYTLWRRALQCLFVVTNSIAFAFEISDWAYFPFTLKRATSDVLNMISRKGDFIGLLPHFLVDYWYAPLGLGLFIFLFSKANSAICRATSIPVESPVWTALMAVKQMTLLLVFSGLDLVAIRGGLQLIPLGNGNAIQVTQHRYVPIVLNTPFSIMHSYSGKLEELNYFPDSEVRQYFDPVKRYGGQTFSKKNVVFIILESYSKEFTGLGGRVSYTPFLDSLMRYSYVCTNAYANALHSAEGIPAILSGLPALMSEPITTSSYATNKLTSLPDILRDEGYSTAFFHGGTNGTMSFDIYAANAGFSKYYGRTEYGNERDYDGGWGIWDEPFLQFFANTLNRTPQPFMGTVFTLSSHDPFKVPEQYKQVLPKGTLPIHKCVGYTDLALRKFFEKASGEPWFRNTLFVLTADHCSPTSKDPYYSTTYMGMYAIPVLFYAPGDTSLSRRNDQVCQQIDILPSVLDYLGYGKPFFAFGNSIFRPAHPRYVANELSGNYLWYMDGYLLTAPQLKPDGLYQISRDSFCKENLMSGNLRKYAEAEMIPYFKAFMQTYRSGIIHNRLHVQ